MSKKSVETGNDEYIELYTADGEVILMLAYDIGNGETEVEARHLDKDQVDALITALQEAKEALEDG